MVAILRRMRASRRLSVATAMVLAVAAAGASLGLGVVDVCASPLPGPSGNVEYFIWLRAGAPAVDAARVRSVVSLGPQ